VEYLPASECVLIWFLNLVPLASHHHGACKSLLIAPFTKVADAKIDLKAVTPTRLCSAHDHFDTGELIDADF